MDNETIALTGLAATPIITALVGALGAAVPALPRRAYPLVAVVIGVAWNVTACAASGDIGWPAPLFGVVAGLAASGLYSAAVKPALRALPRHHQTARAGPASAQSTDRIKND